MSARSFRSVFMVASCAGAALGCYLVSLRVASERAALEAVETKIVLAQRDIRLLETEIGTRGRLAQLERWNVRVLALSAPSADQFLEGGFALARLARPEPKPQIEAPVVLAAAPADAPKPGLPEAPASSREAMDDAARPDRLLHVASLRTPVRELGEQPEADRSRQAAPQKAGDKRSQAAAGPVTRPVRTANIDPLAPLPEAAPSRKSSRVSGSTQ